MVNATKYNDFGNIQQTYAGAAYLRIEHPQYDEKELTKASPKSILKLMDAVKEGNAPKHEILELLGKVNKVAPGETEKLLKRYNKKDIEGFADFLYKTKNEKAIRDLTYVVIGILKTMVLKDYMRK